MTKPKPHSITTEDELLSAMERSDRRVTRAMLGIWRYDGLLPALVRPGLGREKGGAAYFWREKDIRARAFFVHDLLKRYGRTDFVILILWLCGYNVSLVQLRRAWRYKIRMHEPWTAQRAATRAVAKKRPKHLMAPPIPVRKDNVSTSAFLDTVFEICALLVPQHGASEFDLIGRVISLYEIKVGTRAALFGGSKKLAWESIFSVSALSPLLEASYLISAATDSELIEARRYLVTIGLFIRDFVMAPTRRRRGSKGVPIWSSDEAEAIGEPLYLFILALLKSGHQHELHLTAAELEALRTRWLAAVDRRVPLSNARTMEKMDDVNAFRRRLRRIWRAIL
jgi:hypothetical protein